MFGEVAARACHQQLDAGSVQLVVVQGVRVRQQAAAGLQKTATVFTLGVFTLGGFTQGVRVRQQAAAGLQKNSHCLYTGSLQRVFLH